MMKMQNILSILVCVAVLIPMVSAVVDEFFSGKIYQLTANTIVIDKGNKRELLKDSFFKVDYVSSSTLYFNVYTGTGKKDGFEANLVHVVNLTPLTARCNDAERNDCDVPYTINQNEEFLKKAKGYHRREACNSLLDFMDDHPDDLEKIKDLLKYSKQCGILVGHLKKIEPTEPANVSKEVTEDLLDFLKVLHKDDLETLLSTQGTASLQPPHVTVGSLSWLKPQLNLWNMHDIFSEVTKLLLTMNGFDVVEFGQGLKKRLKYWKQCNKLVEFFHDGFNVIEFEQGLKKRLKYWKQCDKLVKFLDSNKKQFEIGGWVKATGGSGVCFDKWFKNDQAAKVVGIDINEIPGKNFGKIRYEFHWKSKKRSEGKTFYENVVPRGKWSYLRKITEKKEADLLKTLNEAYNASDKTIVKARRRRLATMDRLLKEVERAEHAAK